MKVNSYVDHRPTSEIADLTFLCGGMEEITDLILIMKVKCYVDHRPTSEISDLTFLYGGMEEISDLICVL